MDTLFSHVSIVTMDDRMSVWTDSFLGVTDGKISYLGKKAPEEQPQTIIDGSGMVLMPGLINCHTHLPMTILRGYADDLKLQEWLNDYIFPREAHLDDRAVKAAAQLLGGTEERVDCGRVNDHYFVNIFSFGIFTTTSQRTPDKRKHQIGKLAYLIEGVKEFRSVHGIPLQILADGKAFDIESLMALIFNGETAGGFHLAPRSSIKDGMFDCLLLQRRNMLFSVVSMLRHLLGGRPSQVKHFRARTLDITSPINEPTDMDGQKGADFPLHIECLHNELRVVCPLSEAPRRGRFAYFKNLISKLAWWRTR